MPPKALPEPLSNVVWQKLLDFSQLELSADGEQLFEEAADLSVSHMDL